MLRIKENGTKKKKLGQRKVVKSNNPYPVTGTENAREKKNVSIFYYANNK